eukprot:Rhum_TRINITY_DN15249_c5_g2::Rhum_TRINITY_DN15249_c5_g2_i1::g.146101::m.146101
MTRQDNVEHRGVRPERRATAPPPPLSPLAPSQNLVISLNVLSPPPPFYMFVVDLCVGYANNNDIVELRDTLVSAVRGLPQDAVVGVITFGTSISVHEMKTPPPGLPPP